MRTLILNSTNVVPNTYNSQYSYVFPSGGIQFQEGDQICIQSISLPYSNFNISSAYGNNSFQYTLLGTTYTVSIPSSFCTITDLNNLLQQSFIQNGLYLMDSNSNYVFYGQLQLNQALYSYEYDAFAIPTSLPSGYTNPANVLYHSITISTPSTIQLVVPSGFGNLIGFTAGTYPANSQTTNYSITSNKTPNMSPVNSFVVRCSAINNRYSIPPDVLFSFTPSNVQFGSNIVVTPTIPGWIDLRAGSYTSLTLQLVDQNFNSVQFQDYNCCIQILVRSKSEV